MMLTRVCRSCAHASKSFSKIGLITPNITANRARTVTAIRANSTSSSSISATSTGAAAAAPAGAGAGAEDTTSTPKKPSPYRLIPVSTFLADFAPLHVKGWRLDNLPHVRHATKPKEGGMVELQDRHLTRRYDFELGKEGWRDTLRFMGLIGSVIEEEDVSLLV